MGADDEIGVQLRVVEYRVLGPVSVSVEGRALKLGGPRPRTVLAVLLSRANQTVAQDQLIDLVWQGDPPEAAKATLQSYIYGLRREVGADVIVRHGDGYRVETDADHFDALRFEQMVSGAHARVAADPRTALGELTAALSLWYGTPFSGLDGNSALAPEIARLDALRLNAVEHRIDARLAVGDHAGALAELETLVREHPLRERFRGQQMLALYRSGRQAEALRAFQETRRHLAEELGIEPAVALRHLEQQILEQDPALGDSPTANAESLTDRAPQVVRGYELRDAIGSGAFGIVHRAYQPSVGREVAVKVIRPDHTNDPAFVRRFAREASIIAQLEHPHIVPLFDFWRDPGGAYLVMPHLRGGSLAGALSTGAWNLEPAIQLIQQIGGALAYAHRHGVTHRDVKAANVLLDEESNAYLSDFGIATMGDPSGGPDSSGDIVPPERSAGREHTASSDQFCLAVLTYQILTGVLPDVAPPLPMITDARPGLGPDLAEVLARATSESPADRYHNIDAFLRSLRRSVGLDVVPSADPRSRQPDTARRNPYKGLRSFHETDSADFFGREGAVAELQAALAANNVVTVVGPSGCGKSSLVRAGLVPSLRAGAIPGSRSWLFAAMYPGTHPIDELEHALLSVAVDRPSDLLDELYEPHGLMRIAKRILPDDDSTLVLIVDQFEELFSLTSSNMYRDAFVDIIVDVAQHQRSPVKILLTMRADFFDRPLADPQLRAAIAPGVVVVGPPSRDGLTQAIVGPARAVGLDIEPGLVGRVLADIEAQPGALPLLQFVLTELFDARSGDALTIADYQRTGGIVGALSRRADEIYSHLGRQAQEAAMHLFLRLINVEEGSPDTRRRVLLAELRSLDVDQTAVGEVLHRFGGYRLLSFDRDPVSRGPTVEVAHEALLSEWARLGSWLDGRREALVQARRLRLAAQEWEQSSRDPSFLLRGGRLEQARSLTGGGEAVLTGEEVMFLDASVARESRDAATTQRRKRRLVALVGAGLGLVLLLGGIALSQRESALKQSQATVGRRLVADAMSVVETDPDLALLLGLEAVEVADDTSDAGLRVEGLDVLAAATRSQRVVSRPTVEGGIADMSGDGSLVAEVDDTDVRLLASETGANLLTLAGSETVRAAEFDPGSDRIAVAYAAPERGEPFEIIVWDTITGGELVSVTAGSGRRNVTLSWSPDGNRLAVLTWNTKARVSILDLAGGTETQHIEVGTARDVAFATPDTVVISDPSAEGIGVWDLETSRVNTIPTPGIEPDAIDVDATTGRVALVGRDPLRLQVWDLSTGEQEWSVFLPEPVWASSPDVAVGVEQRQVAASTPGRVMIYDVDTGDEVASVEQPSVRTLAFSTRGHRLAGTSDSGAGTVWDTSPHGADAIAAGSEPPCGINVSPDGKRAVLTGADGTLMVVDLADETILTSLPDQNIGFNGQAAVSKDWRYMAWVDEHGQAAVRDATTGKRLLTLPGCVTPKAFSADGSMLLVQSGCDDSSAPPDEGGLTVLDTATGQTVATIDGTNVLGRAAEFTTVPGNDDRELLVAYVDDAIRIHDMPSAELVNTLPERDGLWTAIAVDPGGRYLAASSTRKTVEVFDLVALVEGRDFEEARIVTLDPDAEALGLAFDGDGHLAAAGQGSLHVFDYLANRLIAQPAVTIDTPPFAAFAPDDQSLVYADGGHVLRRHSLDPALLLEQARATVTRPLTDDECQRYLGGSCT